MRLPYLEYSSTPSPADPSTTVFRPAIRLRVIGLAGAVKLWGILDTGSEETILPEPILDAVGAATRTDDIGVLKGFSGTPAVVRYGTVDLEVALEKRVLRWHAKVAFHPGRDSALLGHLGFLQYFAATFNGPERHVTLRPKGAFPPRIMSLE